MKPLRLCGYKLAARGLHVPWAGKPYRGYDREYFIEIGFNPMEDDGSELWRLQWDSLDRKVYFVAIDHVRFLRTGFARIGKELDVLRIRVDVAKMSAPETLQYLPEAEAAPDGDFEVLGYDVGWLMGRHSIIYQPGFMERANDASRQYWSALLNNQGLLRTVEDAWAFRELFYGQPKRESGDVEILEVACLRDDNG